MNKTTRLAFIDESGNFGFEFDKKGCSSHFIITAVIIEENNLTNLETQLEHIRKKYFQTGEMKSQNVGGNDIRRINIILELKDLDFRIFSFIIDKRRLFQDSGLGYKKSFMKYLNNLIYKELYLSYPRLQIITDEHGSKEYMEEFKQYVESKHEYNLFNIYEFGFSNSKSEILIQLADFICGTLATGYEENRKSTKYRDFIYLLKPKLIGIREWPEVYKEYAVDTTKGEYHEYDNMVARLSIDLANDFISKKIDSNDIETREQIAFLKFLLYSLRFQGYNSYVPTKEIIYNLRVLNHKIHNQHLRLKIVGKLRDQGILIASSPRGYKIPVTVNDLFDFVNHASQIIIPMIKRLEKCRNHILLGSNKDMDIIDREEYSELKKFFQI